MFEAIVDHVSSGVDGGGNMVFFVHKNSTLSGGTWTQVDSMSLMEENTTATVSADGHFEMTLEGKDKRGLEPGRLQLFPGENVTVTVSATKTNGDADLTIEWAELY